MRTLGLLIAAALVLAGCGTSTQGAKITRADYDAIEAGDNCDDLSARFGEPISQNEASVDLGTAGSGRLHAQDLAWQLDDGSVMVVTCHDGKVASKALSK